MIIFIRFSPVKRFHALYVSVGFQLLTLLNFVLELSVRLRTSNIIQWRMESTKRLGKEPETVCLKVIEAKAKGQHSAQHQVPFWRQKMTDI